MGDYSYLVGWNAELGTGVGPELEAKYYVPLFWRAMFDPENVRSTSTDGDAFVKPPNATDAFEDHAYAYVEGAVALSRLKERLPRLGAATSEALAKKFLAFAKAYAEHHVVLRLSALADGRAEWLTKFRDSLRVVADPASSTEALRNVGDLGHGWDAQPYAENQLIGWGTQLTVREKELAKKKKATPKRTAAEREHIEQWRTSTEQIPAERRLPYRASGTFSDGDVIEHAKFGPGLVLRIVDKTKIEVQFGTGPVVLVHTPA